MLCKMFAALQEVASDSCISEFNVCKTSHVDESTLVLSYSNIPAVYLVSRVQTYHCLA